MLAPALIFDSGFDSYDVSLYIYCYMSLCLYCIVDSG